MNVRALAVTCLLLAAACSGPASVASSTPTASPSNGHQLSSGGVVEYSLTTAGGSSTALDSLPNMTRGPDGNIWFIELFSRGDGNVERLARITPSGAITDFALPGSGLFGTFAITGGPDGNLWMVGVSGAGAGPTSSWIRRVTVTGEVTDFALAPEAAPNAITTGPDANIWFTEPARNKVGRITPTGQISEFATPTAGRSPSGIIAGTDGNLWFTEYAWNNGAVARISTTGVITEYPIPANDLKVGCGDSAMAAGLDGSIWFAEPNSFGIGRITPAGALSEFGGSGTGCARGLMVGPDGSTWFTGGATVGRINTAGAVRQFGLPSLNAQSSGIAVGADGRIWFTELGVNRVASIGVTVPELSLGSPLLNFGRPTGSPSLTVAITNTGDAGLKIISATILGPDSTAFAKAGDDCSGRALAAGAGCQVTIRFSPSADSGLRAARLQLVDNATGSPHSVSLIADLPDCKLPLVDEPSLQGPHHGRFLSLVSGDATSDPAGGFTWVPDQQANRSINEPFLSGIDNFSYDWLLRRWLPVESQAVSPDGSRYAYTGYDSAFHVVDVSTGRDRVLPGVLGRVLAFSRDGIYLVAGDRVGSLLLVDPDTGTVRKVLEENGILAVGDGAAWIGAANPADPAPFQPGMGAVAYDQISRRDLATGAVTTWFYRSATAVQVAAIAAGVLVLTTETAAAQDVWIVSGPNSADRLMIGVAGDPFPLAGTVTGDASGLWLAGPQGVYLWTSRTGLILISTTKGTPAGTCS